MFFASLDSSLCLHVARYQSTSSFAVLSSDKQLKRKSGECNVGHRKEVKNASDKVQVEWVDETCCFKHPVAVCLRFWQLAHPLSLLSFITLQKRRCITNDLCNPAHVNVVTFFAAT